MPARPRPLLAVRLIGPADTVTTQKNYLTAYYAKVFRHQATTCRTTTHAARHTGEIRTYITITAKDNE